MDLSNDLLGQVLPGSAMKSTRDFKEGIHQGKEKSTRGKRGSTRGKRGSTRGKRDLQRVEGGSARKQDIQQQVFVTLVIIIPPNYQ